MMQNGTRTANDVRPMSSTAGYSYPIDAKITLFRDESDEYNVNCDKSNEIGLSKSNIKDHGSRSNSSSSSSSSSSINNSRSRSRSRSRTSSQSNTSRVWSRKPSVIDIYVDKELKEHEEQLLRESFGQCYHCRMNGVNINGMNGNEVNVNGMNGNAVSGNAINGNAVNGNTSQHCSNCNHRLRAHSISVDTPCKKHHHRRNSVCVKFQKMDTQDGREDKDLDEKNIGKRYEEVIDETQRLKFNNNNNNNNNGNGDVQFKNPFQ
ncbi:hypothetical protein ACO0RG_003079 [Hanseniaspora osmophila]